MNQRTSHHVNPLFMQFIDYLKNQNFKGDLNYDLSTQIINATDNSIYELMPMGVIAPHDIKSLTQIVIAGNLTQFQNLKFYPRGGGTGTNGQALGEGIVIDTSLYLKKISELNLEQQTVRVEAGVVLSQLNNYLKPYGLFFAPHTSTANRATIGGMIATDAAGKGSLIYGKTSNHIVALDCVTANGTYCHFTKTTLSACNGLESTIAKLLTNFTTQINVRFQPSKRPLSGYNLQQSLDEQNIDLTQLIAGSEGTLALIAQATLKLTKIPAVSILILIHYSDFLSAVKDAEFLLTLNPAAIEVVDDKIQASIKTLANYNQLIELMKISINDEHLPITNFVEFNAANNVDLEKILNLLKIKLKAHRYVIIDNVDDIAKLWNMRALAVGLLSRNAREKIPIAFIEDAMVPPENLYFFIQELQQLLVTFNLDYALYGHLDVGCIHLRPALNLQNPAERKKIRPLSEAMLTLVNKYHGIFWGEHGKGIRGEFVATVFGPILYPVLQQVKNLFDPQNRLNSGKLVSPNNQNTVWKIDQVTMRGELDAIIPANIQNKYQTAMICNGNGACFNQDAKNVMCPSYKITQDRVHSPKGRAMLIKAWLRAKSSIIQDKKLVRVLADQTLVALNGCLGCKGCSGKCPTGVSIPELRSLFFQEYYTLYRNRPLRDIILAHIEEILYHGAKMPKLWNFIVPKLPTMGIVNPAQISLRENFSTMLKRHQLKLYQGKAEQLNSNNVVILFDVFSSVLEHQILISTVSLLRKMNFEPLLLKIKNSGKAFLVYGMIKKFKHAAAIISQQINQLAAHKIPVLGLENSLSLIYRDEYPLYNFLLTTKVLTLGEFLVNHRTKLPQLKIDPKISYCLLPHCSEQAIHPDEAYHWQSIFNQIGIKLEVQNLGCCGMAGNYGHLKEWQNNSQQLFKLHWQPTLLDSKFQYLASGYSCRTQAKLLIQHELKHPVVIIDQN